MGPMPKKLTKNYTNGMCNQKKRPKEKNIRQKNKKDVNEIAFK